MKVIGLELRIQIRPEKRAEFLQMREMLRGKEQSSDCVDLKVYEEVDGSNSFLWLERWKGKEPLERYMDSDQFRVLLGAIDVLGALEGMQTVEIS